VKQAQVDKLYASLKDLSGDRRLKLDEVLKLYLLNRDIEDLEQWIAEREVVAGSHELGQDFEHVTMLRDRFKDFAGDTESIGQERVAAVNEACDRLIATGHSDAAVIAEWKDTINEMWTDLLEMIDTRTQMLAASYELFKFYNDCKETLDRIHEKEVLMPDEIGRDAQTTAALQRRHLAYEHELIALGLQVQLIQEAAANLIVATAVRKRARFRTTRWKWSTRGANYRFVLMEDEANWLIPMICSVSSTWFVIL
jgi:spectrin beta